MNDKLEQILQFLLESAQAAQNFSQEQIPLVAQEIVAYGRAVETGSAVASIFALSVIGYAFKKTFQWIKKEDAWDASPLLALFSIPAIPSILWTFESFDGALMAWFAPRLYLIEYVSNLIK